MKDGERVEELGWQVWSWKNQRWVKRNERGNDKGSGSECLYTSFHLLEHRFITRFDHLIESAGRLAMSSHAPCA